MKTWIRRLAVVAALVAVGVILKVTAFRPAPVPVTIFRVARGRVEETVTNSKAGTVKTRQRASLAPEVGGRVAELNARKGQVVAAGDVLLRIADTDLRAQLALQSRAVEAARAGERESCVEADQAERDLARTDALAKEAIVSKGVLEQAQSRRDTTRAACAAAGAAARQAEAARDLATVNLNKTVLRAPFSGVVAETHVEVGEWVTPSPPVIQVPGVVELIDPAQIYVSAPLDEVDAGKVSVGQIVRVTLDPFPGRSFAGHLTRVAPYVQDLQDQNRTFEVEATLDDADFARTLLPGTTADVEVILASREGSLRVPSYSLLEGGQVLCVRDRRLRSVAVKTGLRNWEFTEVTDGLAEGDQVVVSLDRPEVKAGARIAVAGETLK